VQLNGIRITCIITCSITRTVIIYGLWEVRSCSSNEVELIELTHKGRGAFTDGTMHVWCTLNDLRLLCSIHIQDIPEMVYNCFMAHLATTIPDLVAPNIVHVEGLFGRTVSQRRTKRG